MWDSYHLHREQGSLPQEPGLGAAWDPGHSPRDSCRLEPSEWEKLVCELEEFKVLTAPVIWF